MGLFGSSKQVTVDYLVERYASALSRGPSGTGTLHELARLPAEKPLMKAAFVAQAHKLGAPALEALRTAFVSLATFQEDLREPAGRHSEIATEMTVLALKFDARTKALREKSDA
jgi:hypothetical protein